METENLAGDIEIRRRIYGRIQQSPGLYERELSRLLSIPLSTLDYHLYHLKKRGLVTFRSEGGYTRYYIMGTVDEQKKQLLGVLRQRMCRNILLFLLLHPNAFHREICEQVQLAPSTVSFHLNKLVALKVLTRNKTGRDTSYVINDPLLISDLLITYRTSFLDDSVDQFIAVWSALNPQPTKNQKNKDAGINLLVFS